jgi:hypothetical protein
MLKKHFHPYRVIITKAINNCTTAEDLHCCNDMLHHFKEHFQKMMPDEYAEANELLGVLYLQKQHEING